MDKASKLEVRDLAMRLNSLHHHNTVLSTLAASLSAGPEEQPAVKFYQPQNLQTPSQEGDKISTVTQRLCKLPKINTSHQ